MKLITYYIFNSVNICHLFIEALKFICVNRYYIDDNKKIVYMRKFKGRKKKLCSINHKSSPLTPFNHLSDFT